MITPVAEDQKPALEASEEKPPETASQEQPGAPPEESAPEPKADQPPPSPQQVIEEAVGAIDDDTLAALVSGLPPERYDKLLGQEIDRRAQSRADRSDSDTRLDGEVSRLQAEHGQRFFDLKQSVEQEEVKPVIDKAGAQGMAYQQDLDQRYLTNALGRVGIALTDDDRRRLDSVRGDGTDPQTRIRNTIEVYVSRAREIGRTEAPELVRKQVEAETGVAEKLLKLTTLLKGGAAAAPAPEVSTESERDRLANPNTSIDELMRIRAQQKGHS